MREYQSLTHIHATLCLQRAVQLRKRKNSAFAFVLVVLFVCAVFNASTYGSLYAKECLHVNAAAFIVCWLVLLMLFMSQTVERATHYHVLACRMQRLANSMENDLVNNKEVIDHMHVFCMIKLYHEMVDSVVYLLPDTMLHTLYAAIQKTTSHSKQQDTPSVHAAVDVCEEVLDTESCVSTKTEKICGQDDKHALDDKHAQDDKHALDIPLTVVHSWPPPERPPRRERNNTQSN